MDGYNLFEPDLELDVNTIPYEDMGIQGVWPRKQRTPSDVFPANANLIARGEDNKARWCKADKDGILYTHSLGGGGGSTGPFTLQDYNLSQTADSGIFTHLGSAGPPDKPIRGIIISVSCTLGSFAPSQLYGYFVVYVQTNSVEPFRLANIALNISPTGVLNQVSGQAHIMFPPGLLVFDPRLDSHDNLDIYCDSPNASPGWNLDMHIWQDA